MTSTDWRAHIRELGYRWLLGDRPPGCIGDTLLMPLGNPDRFPRAIAIDVLGELREEGVFRFGTLDGRPIALTTPRFGGPSAAMYVEVAAMAGVRRIVAFGFTGGLRPETAIGSAFVARDALGLDGTTLAYGRGAAIPDAEPVGGLRADMATRGAAPVVGPTDAAPDARRTEADSRDVPRVWPADDALSDRLEAALTAERLPWTAGRMATIDAIMLEDDAMVATLAARDCAAIDMETAALYAVAQKLGLRTSSVHLVSDNPFGRDTNPADVHRPSYGRVLALAARVALAE